MRKPNPFFLLCLAGTILLAAGIILLPRYFSRSMDIRNMNKVAAANRDDFSFLETSSGSVVDTVHALGKIKRDGSNLKLITAFNNSARINDELLDQVYDQAIDAVNFGFLPWIGIGKYDISLKMGWDIELYESWIKYIRSAKYYSLTYDSETHPNTKEILNLWFLRFSDGESFDYYFLVDAINYRIYYAEIYNVYTDQIVLLAESVYHSIDMTEKEKQKQKTLNISVSGDSSTIYDYMHEIYAMNEALFPDGSALYYGAQECRYVNPANLTDKLALVVLGFDLGTIYLEQLAMPENDFPYRGISVGFQGMGEKIQSLMKE